MRNAELDGAMLRLFLFISIHFHQLLDISPKREYLSHILLYLPI